MRNKSLFLLVAGICGTIAAVGVGQWMQAQNNSPVVKTVEILVTTQAISAEEQVSAEKLRLEQWPADRVPTGASGDLAKFEGRFAKVPLFAGEPMLDMKLMDEVEDQVVPRGYTVVSLDASGDGTANLARPGDRVDIRGFFRKGEMFPRDMALNVLTGVKVYGIDGKTKFDEDEPRSRNARNIQLLIRKADAEAFDFAKKLGDISLSLGSPSADDKNIPEGEPSEAALTFMQDLQEYRAEQERLRAAGEIEDDSDSVSVASAPKKATFRTTQIVNGRMIIYEWREGESLPRIVGDTGENQASTTGPSGSQADGTGTTTMPTFEDDLSGSDSPFFESEGGQESEI